MQALKLTPRFHLHLKFRRRESISTLSHRYHGVEFNKRRIYKIRQTPKFSRLNKSLSLRAEPGHLVGTPTVIFSELLPTVSQINYIQYLMREGIPLQTNCDKFFCYKLYKSIVISGLLGRVSNGGVFSSSIYTTVSKHSVVLSLSWPTTLNVQIDSH
jgi:hypothetical protein